MRCLNRLVTSSISLGVVSALLPFAASAQEVGDPQPDRDQSEKLTPPYVGEWQGTRGDMVLNELLRQGIRYTAVDLGFDVDELSFEVSEDGSISGSGTATYWFNVKGGADGPPPLNIQAESHLEGGAQTLSFPVAGRMQCTPDPPPPGSVRPQENVCVPNVQCTVTLKGQPDAQLVVVGPGQRESMDAWPIFGPREHHEVRGDSPSGRLYIEESAVLPRGMKLQWLVQKETCDRPMVAHLEGCTSTYELLRENAYNQWQAVILPVREIAETYRTINKRTISAMGKMLYGEAWAQVFRNLPAESRAIARTWLGGRKLTLGDVLGGAIDLARGVGEAAGRNVADLNYLARFYRVMKRLIDTLSENYSDKLDVRPLAAGLMNDMEIARELTEDVWLHYDSIMSSQRNWCPGRTEYRPAQLPYSPPDLSREKAEIALARVLAEGLEIDSSLIHLARFFREYEGYKANERRQ